MPVLTPARSSGSASADVDGLARQLGAARSGDAAAYRGFIAGCVPLIRQIARAQAHRGICIDDLVQDVCLSLHRTLPAYDAARPLQPWLATIVQRRARDLIRRRRRQGLSVSIDDHTDELAAPVGEPCAVDAARLGATLRAAIAALPARQREAVLHVGLSEMSVAEAARRTGVRCGTVRVNYHRGLRALRRTLNTLREQFL